MSLQQDVEAADGTLKSLGLLEGVTGHRQGQRSKVGGGDVHLERGLVTTAWHTLACISALPCTSAGVLCKIKRDYREAFDNVTVTEMAGFVKLNLVEF